MGKNNIFFILHKPQLSENIGACARAMKNFDFKRLILINPKPIFPNDKILATSVGAKNIINKSKVYENLEQALNNVDLVIATSARFRNKNIKHSCSTCSSRPLTVNTRFLKKDNKFAVVLVQIRT